MQPNGNAYFHSQTVRLGYPLLRGATWLPAKHKTKKDEKKAGGRQDGGSDEGMKVVVVVVGGVYHKGTEEEVMWEKQTGSQAGLPNV